MHLVLIGTFVRNKRNLVVVRNAFYPPECLLFGWESVTNGSSRCLKITEKVSFNIASEASYVYNLGGQKFIKNAKNGHFDEFLKT